MAGRHARRRFPSSLPKHGRPIWLGPFATYEKKRGHRRTGSRTFGNLGEAIFFAVFLVLGSAGLIAGLLLLVIPEWRVNHGFVEQTCTVIERRVAEIEKDGRRLYGPVVRIRYQVGDTTYGAETYDIHRAYYKLRADEAGGEREVETGGKRWATWSYDVSQAYGIDLQGSQEAIDQFVKGQQYRCWYDPANPRIVVLVRGYSGWIWLIFFVPASFIAIVPGAWVYTLLRWGKSAERRAAMVQRVRPAELFESNGAAGPKFPGIPDPSDITSSPGTRLAYRLPIGSSPAWALSGLLLACLLWNGTVSVLLVQAIASYFSDEPAWLLTLFIIPFALVGAALAAVFVRQLLVTTGIGPTRVEISHHPLLPGGQYRVFVSQSGRLKVHALEVTLVCEEQATYRQGTNTRTETREVYRQPLLRREQFEIQRGDPLEAEFDLAVPPGAMHSLKANHNEVTWRVLVQGELAGWPRFERSFSVIVYPAHARAGERGAAA